MKQRCPHCQTTPLRADAQTCWYCGKDYAAKPRLPRHARLRAVDSFAATLGAQGHREHGEVAAFAQASRCSLRGHADASTVAR